MAQFRVSPQQIRIQGRECDVFFAFIQYVGTWLNGEFQSGEWKFKDGSCYKGSFKGGRPAPGEGTFLFPNGNRQMGKWVQTTSEELDAEGKPKTNVFWVGGDLVVGQTG